MHSVRPLLGLLCQYTAVADAADIMRTALFCTGDFSDQNKEKLVLRAEQRNRDIMTMQGGLLGAHIIAVPGTYYCSVLNQYCSRCAQKK